MYTAIDATAAPMNANHTELAAPASPSDSAITTAAEAPAFTPSRPGSASGLRVSACISAPATPIAAPTAIPSSVRGTRRLRMIASSCEEPECSSASTTSASGIERAPTARLSSAANASRPRAIASPALRVKRPPFARAAGTV